MHKTDTAITLEVGVKAFIKNTEGKFLVLKRAKPFTGETRKRWDIPGGRIIPGEKLEQALQREIKEETGLQIDKIITVLAAQDILRVKGRHTVRLTYLVACHNPGTIILLPEEHTEYQWVSLKKLQSLRHDTFLDQVIKQLAQQ